MTVERFPVEAGHILQFARAIGDTNPIYSSEERAAETEPRGIICPPTFVQASAQFDPDYRNRPMPGRPWRGSGRVATGVDPDAPDTDGSRVGGRLHAEQHFTYHRHPGPGDVLHTVMREGDRWEKTSSRAGRLLFVETITEYRDRNDELVVTARSVSVQTERPVEN